MEAKSIIEAELLKYGEVEYEGLNLGSRESKK